MNEYLYEIMNDANLTDDEWDMIITHRKHRGKSYSQKCLSYTLGFECLTDKNVCDFDSYK